MSEPTEGPRLSDLVKSRRRVADHGEVFTPDWLVEDMLDQIKAETERIEARVLEPACGSGNFLVPILARKLAAVEARHGRSEFERKHYALYSLMCVYGIEILPDNTQECRNNLLVVFCNYLGITVDAPWARAAKSVLRANIVQGDALEMKTPGGAPITFAEWGYLGAGKFQRRDFRYDALTERSSFEGTLWESFEEHEIFAPTRSYPVQTFEEIAL